METPSNTPLEILAYLFIGALLGAVGQGVRVIVGIKKQNQDHPTEKLGDWFDSGRMLLSLLIGAIAGTLSATILLGTEINRQFLLTIIAAGYAGTDFIEGFLKSQNLPQNLPQDIPRMALQAEEPEE